MPGAGLRVEAERERRRLPVRRTSFFVVYRATPARIEILRVFDGRAFDAGLEE